LLPRATERPVVQPHDDPVRTDERRNVPEDSILVVEDNDEVATLVEEMLRELGHHVTRVASPAAALDALVDGRSVSMLFSDIMMPGEMDGVELGREVRLRKKNMPVLLTSGFAEANASRAEAEGFRVLAKPYRLDELAAALDSARRDAYSHRQNVQSQFG
jgi:CheY-like chemotaxis protein